MSEKFRGTFTALVTPFRADQSVDEERVRQLVELQVSGRVEGLVPCGTTGEAPTLTNEEHLRVIEIAADCNASRVQLLAGVGGNNTANVILLAREAERLGANGVLATAPYYNKPTQEGMYRHFCEIADAIGIPLVLYNVPGRTSSNLLPSTVLRLAEHGNIQGIKEASGDLGQANAILTDRPDGFRVLSGDDELALPLIAIGGDGVVSVASNEVPLQMANMVREGLAGRLVEARQLHHRLLGLMRANFVETNPVPVKAALAMMGHIEEQYRLPLVPLAADNRDKLRRELEQLGLIQS